MMHLTSNRICLPLSKKTLLQKGRPSILRWVTGNVLFAAIPLGRFPRLSSTESTRYEESSLHPIVEIFISLQIPFDILL